MNTWGRRALWALLGIGIGALAGGIIGMVTGVVDRGLGPFIFGMAVVCILPAFMGITAGRSVVRTAGLREAVRDLGATVPADAVREVARIESLREAGLTVRNFHHLFEFTVTVFPRAGRPRRETFSQFITLGDLPNFSTGRYVVIATTSGSPQATMLDQTPSAEWTERVRTAPERYDGITAPDGAPTASEAAAATSRSGESVTLGRPRGRVAFVAGFAVLGLIGALLIAYGGPSRLIAVVTEIPQRLSGQVHGLWDSDRLDAELRDVATALGDRDLEYVVLFDDYLSVAAHSATDPTGLDVYRGKDGVVTELWTSTTSTSYRPFTVADIDPGVIRHAARTVYADTPDAVITAVQIRDLVTQGFQISISVEGRYQDVTRVFDAETGEERTG